jgi:hypothetical protein
MALAALAAIPVRAGAVTTATGFATYSITTPGTVQGDVVRAGRSIFVGQGTFGVGNEQVIRLDDGMATTIATGFNSLGGFALGANGTLYVVDNNGNGMGALTGDTVFAIPDALIRTTALPAVGAEVVPAGSIPAAADVTIDGKDLIVTDAGGPGAGRVVRVSKGTVTDLITTGLDYAAGVTIDGTRLLVGNVDDPSFVGSVSEYTLDGALVGPAASGLSGNYGHDLDNAGNILVTGGFRNDFSSSNLVAAVPGGAVSERAWGFTFSSGLHHDQARDETLILDVGVSRIDVICRNGGGGTCVADVPCTGGAAITDAKLLLKKQGTGPGDDGLKLVGQMTVPNTPTLDPLTNGARIAVSDTAGTVANVVVPPGAFDDATGIGWKLNGTGTVSKYLNPSGHAGIVKVVVKTIPKTPGLVKIIVVGRDGFFPTKAAALPLTATFVLDPDGQCGQATFAACAFNDRGTTVKCE